eukprot:TRINITY_DN2467_c0_g1::TRINITY_DN2467_c0_g1_i1::g.8728::m.8728 TRINITY_DN2467_c0_g1::TRINITY_DN2467_c0_g1_i1::g.8728  ORF type:complete len:310 (+),score=15.15,DUF2669/PF10876.3/4.8e+03,DUF2669/PF10876.3/2.4e+02,DUF2669/PF10876.3/0.4,DUF2669/PF10876.3/3.1e+03 TRINITY_DN2467_c0_g1_i1:1116-2045(+)
MVTSVVVTSGVDNSVLSDIVREVDSVRVEEGSLVRVVVGSLVKVLVGSLVKVLLGSTVRVLMTVDSVLVIKVLSPEEESMVLVSSVVGTVVETSGVVKVREEDSTKVELSVKVEEGSLVRISVEEGSLVRISVEVGSVVLGIVVSELGTKVLSTVERTVLASVLVTSGLVNVELSTVVRVAEDTGVERSGDDDISGEVNVEETSGLVNELLGSEMEEIVVMVDMVEEGSLVRISELEGRLEISLNVELGKVELGMDNEEVSEDISVIVSDSVTVKLGMDSEIVGDGIVREGMSVALPLPPMVKLPEPKV